MRWLKSGLPSLAGRLLVEGLETACLEAGAARGWIISGDGSDRYELVACLGTVAPTRLQMIARLEDWSQPFNGNVLTALSPFPGVEQARGYPMGTGGLLLESLKSPQPRTVERICLALERIEAGMHLERLQDKLKADQEEPAQTRLSNEIKTTGRRTEALNAWYRQAAGTLASAQLATTLPSVAARAASMLEAEFSAVLVYEDRRVRLWGGEVLREKLGPVFSARKLGSLGRRVLESGESFISSENPGKLEKNQVFSELGIQNLMALPLKIEERILGALLVGGRKERQFDKEEVELGRLMAYQTALFLENALMAHGADVERVVARAVLESMADGVFTLDWQKRITSFNPAAEAITGWSAERAIGKTCEEVMRSQYLCPGTQPTKPGSCKESCPLVMLLSDQKLMDSGITVEGSILTSQGNSRYVSSTYSVVADKGDLLGAVVLFRDITEKKAIEQMKSDYAAALSHDLKTPLTAMKGYAVTLLRHGMKLDEETRQDALEVINSEIDRVTRMFDNLLHQARMEAGQHGRFIEAVGLHNAVKRVVNVHQVSSRRHKFAYSVPEQMIIRADRDQLDQILNNLVSNAVKYSPGGCSIEITARAEGRLAYVEVKDTGPGIPEDQLPFVFERFRRVQDRMSRKVSGSGLGLYITRMLVEGMEGEVGVESTFGKGSTFWFRLPLHRI